MGQLFYWKTHLGYKTLADCTPAAIAEQRDILKATPIASRAKSDQARAAASVRYPGPATVNRYLAALSHAFTYAVKELGWTDENPLLKTGKEKEPNGRTRFLSEEERDALLTACRQSISPDLYPAVVLALSTGARQMEIMRLTWKQIDLTRRVALLEETKNGERRILPLTGLALDLLRDRAKVRRLDTDLVFPARMAKTGHPGATVRPVDLRTPFETALARAKIEDFTWHDLRHTAASYLAMNGASLTEIAAILGHKTLAMVKRYSHLSEAHTAGVVERMNRRMFGTA
jgi:integrase